jgi:ArsR family transcriptional regulator
MLEEQRHAQLMADVFTALAHPRRVVILECLLERERPVGELAACERLAPSTQANTSQHLAVLRKAGLIKERREGNKVIYRVATPRVEELLKEAKQLSKERVKAML